MQIMRFDTSMESLITVGRSESFADLNNPEYGVSRSFMASQVHRDLFSQCEYFFLLEFIVGKSCRKVVLVS